jgi:hypothetical protein
MGGRSPDRLGRCQLQASRRRSSRTLYLAEQIEEALRDADRIQAELAARKAHQVIGRTSPGRWLVVIWIDDRDGRYPIHAREASKRIIRRISN